MEINFSDITERFGINSKAKNVININTGHINKTYKIETGSKAYILQQLNGRVFNEPVHVMKNIENICMFLNNHIKLSKTEPSLILSEYMYAGKNNYYIDENGDLWRMYPFIDNTVSLNTLENGTLIYGFGNIIGKFHHIFYNMPTEELYETIPNFHNTALCLEKLLDTKIYDEGYDSIYDFFKRMYLYAEKLKYINMPKTVVHNDAKCSNVLFDVVSMKAVAIIDLDTVMPGSTAFDFGDAVRSSCCCHDNFSMEKFKIFLSGYAESFTAGNINSSAYALSILNAASELASRYFYDYITEENYFENTSKIAKLNRTKELIKLSESIEKNINLIENIISRYM